jgi:hypothetical protein
MFANPTTRSRKYKSDFLFYFIFIQFTLTLWNPTIHPVTHIVRVPVTNDYTILDPQGQTIPSDVNIKIN